MCGELPSVFESQIGLGENIAFNFSDVQHYLSVINLSETRATIIIASEKQTFELTVGDTININLDEDATAEVSMYLSSINIITKKAKFVLTRLTTPTVADRSLENGKEKETIREKSPTENESPPEVNDKRTLLYILFGVGIGVIILVIILLMVLSRRKSHWTGLY